MTASAIVSIVSLLSATLCAPLAAQWLDHPTPGIPRSPDGKPNLSAAAPKTPDGKPDLSGVWYRLSPKYGRNIAADLKPGEVQPWAETLVQQRHENLSKDSMNTLCLPLGPAYTTAGRRHHQRGDDENRPDDRRSSSSSTRISPIARCTWTAAHWRPRPIRIGWDTRWGAGRETRWWSTVSDSTTGRGWIPRAIRTVRRCVPLNGYRRRNLGTLDIEMTLSDPTVYAKPWTVAVSAELAADTEMLEYVCNENNKNREHWVGTAADDRKSGIKVAPGDSDEIRWHLRGAAEILEPCSTHRPDQGIWRCTARRHGWKGDDTAGGAVGNFLLPGCMGWASISSGTTRAR